MDNKLKYFKLGKDFDQEEEKLPENQAIYLFVFSTLCFALSNSIIKNLKSIKPDHNEFSFLLDRYFFYAFINYLVCKRNDIDLSGIQKDDIKWMLGRNISFFFGFFLTNLCLNYLRLGTAICLMMLAPMWMSILSIFVLKENFHMRYLIGAGVCFLGTIFMSINERSDNNPGKKISYFFIFIGFLCGLLSSGTTALANIASKVLADKYDSNYVNLIFGVWSSIISLCMGFLTANFWTDSFNCVIINHALINAIVSYFSLHYLNLSYKYIEVSKVNMLGYLQLIFACIIGYFYFDEKIFMLDFLGASMIIGYNVYNVFVISK